MIFCSSNAALKSIKMSCSESILNKHASPKSPSSSDSWPAYQTPTTAAADEPTTWRAAYGAVSEIDIREA